MEIMKIIPILYLICVSRDNINLNLNHAFCKEQYSLTDKLLKMFIVVYSIRETIEAYKGIYGNKYFLYQVPSNILITLRFVHI